VKDRDRSAQLRETKESKEMDLPVSMSGCPQIMVSLPLSPIVLPLYSGSHQWCLTQLLSLLLASSVCLWLVQEKRGERERHWTQRHTEKVFNMHTCILTHTQV
jgi:hypothetical protein